MSAAPETPGDQKGETHSWIRLLIPACGRQDRPFFWGCSTATRPFFTAPTATAFSCFTPGSPLAFPRMFWFEPSTGSQSPKGGNPPSTSQGTSRRGSRGVSCKVGWTGRKGDRDGTEDGRGRPRGTRGEAPPRFWEDGRTVVNGGLH